MILGLSKHILGSFGMLRMIYGDDQERSGKLISLETLTRLNNYVTIIT